MCFAKLTRSPKEILDISIFPQISRDDKTDTGGGEEWLGEWKRVDSVPRMSGDSDQRLSF